MSGRFYAAWAIALVLASVLPIAIPLALWPPREGAHYGDMIAECGRRAENDAARETPFIWMPLSSEVQSCERAEDGSLTYRATVQARGPYGIPYASGSVGPRDIEHLHEDGGVALSVAALLAGMFAVSIPFTLFWLRTTLPGRLQPAA